VVTGAPGREPGRAAISSAEERSFAAAVAAAAAELAE